MSLEELKARNEELATEIADAEVVRETLSGSEKGQVTNQIKALKQEVEEVEAKIIELEGTDDAKAPEKKTLDQIEDGESVVVKNISRFIQHNGGDRFVPQLEKRTVMRGFVRSSIAAGILVLLDK